MYENSNLRHLLRLHPRGKNNGFVLAVLTAAIWLTLGTVSQTKEVTRNV